MELWNILDRFSELLQTNSSLCSLRVCGQPSEPSQAVYTRADTVKSGNFVIPTRENNFFLKFLRITWCFFLIKSCLNSRSKWYHRSFEKFLISRPPFLYICMGYEITGPSTNFVTPSKLGNLHSLR
jgi:hypothetical protein